MNEIKFSKLNNPEKWELPEPAFKCLNHEEAKKAEKIFNELSFQLDEVLKASRDFLFAANKIYFQKSLENAKEFLRTNLVLDQLIKKHSPEPIVERKNEI